MLFPFDTSHTVPFLLVGFAGTVILIVALTVWIVLLNKRINRLLGGSGTSAKTIEEGIHTLAERIESLETFETAALQHMRTLEFRVRRSTQASATVRFNPFKGNGEGGNQSFATAFVNENGDGVVLSSLYSRERVSVFSKPIKNFKPTFELSEEEHTALTQAIETLSTKNLSIQTEKNA